MIIVIINSMSIVCVHMYTIDVLSFVDCLCMCYGGTKVYGLGVYGVLQNFKTKYYDLVIKL